MPLPWQRILLARRGRLRLGESRQQMRSQGQLVTLGLAQEHGIDMEGSDNSQDRRGLGTGTPAR